MKTYTKDELLAMLDPAHHKTVSNWLARGDGCAVYENAALDSSSLGHKQFVSYGSEKAQLEVVEPPTRLPDIGNNINWAYQLIGVCKGE